VDAEIVVGAVADSCLHLAKLGLAAGAQHEPGAKERRLIEEIKSELVNGQGPRLRGVHAEEGRAAPARSDPPPGRHPGFRHRVRNMETVKVGIREFREKLADYIESSKPLAITRHGETLGFYIPAQKRSRPAQLDAMRAAEKDLDEMIASWGATEEELMDDYKEIRRVAREKRRNAR